MDLRQLAHVVALAEERHFTRAAARVHLAQSSFSASIAALERELGEALFVRDRRRVVLTAAGRALLPGARRALAAADEVRAAVRGTSDVLTGELRVGAIAVPGVVDLPALLAAFHRRHPRVAVRLGHDSAGALAAAVAATEIDLAVVDCPTDPAHLTAVSLGRDHLVLAVPTSDPLAHRESIGLDDAALTSREFVEYRADSALRAQVDTACAAAGLARRVSGEVDSMAHLVACVRSGLGIAVVPAAAAEQPGVVAVPLDPAWPRTVSAVRAAGRAPTPPVRALLDLLVGRGEW